MNFEEFISQNKRKETVVKVEHTQLFKKGDFITVVSKKDSKYNVYKGHHGEILEYNKNTNTAYIRINTRTTNTPLELNQDHFILRKT